MSRTIVIARFNHETNTFSPVPTPLDAFSPQWGAAALRDQQGARTAMGAFIDIAGALPGVELVTPVAAMANPSGTVDALAYRTICATILDAIAAAGDDCCAIMLDLHGAMVAQDADDGEGLLLQAIRRIAPAVPLCLALDLHGNVTQAMVESCDIIVGFKTYPHIDMYETGAHAGRLLVDMLAGRIAPVTRWRQLPLLSHTLMSNTSASAMQAAVEAALRAEEEPGILAVSVMAGFSLADFADAGMSVIVVADAAVETADAVAAVDAVDNATGRAVANARARLAAAEQSADAVAERIGRRIWQDRAQFVYRSEPVLESLQRAQALADDAGAASGSHDSPASEAGQPPAMNQPRGPVLLLDHSDNVMSGGSCDTMDVLQAALDAGLTDIAVGPLCDPAALEALWPAEIGTCMTITLGNRTQLTAQGLKKTPPQLQGTVMAKSDGDIRVTGPIYTGSLLQMGRTVLFDIGAAQIVVTQERVEPYDLGVFGCVGIDPAQKTYLLLKSRMYCRPVFAPLARGLVECDSDSGGPTSSNYALFPFARVRRPVYPLDLETDFT